MDERAGRMPHISFPFIKHKAKYQPKTRIGYTYICNPCKSEFQVSQTLIEIKDGKRYRAW